MAPPKGDIHMRRAAGNSTNHYFIHGCKDMLFPVDKNRCLYRGKRLDGKVSLAIFKKEFINILWIQFLEKP